MAPGRSRRVSRRLLFRDGTVTGFVDEIAVGEIEVEVIRSKRVARVCPSNTLIRGLFLVIRACVKDSSAIADWTRRWPVAWSICAKGRVAGRFLDRQEAIRVEKRLFSNCAIDTMSRNGYLKKEGK